MLEDIYQYILSEFMKTFQAIFEVSRLMYTLIRVSWAASGSLLKFPLYDFNDYDDDWPRF